MSNYMTKLSVTVIQLRNLVNNCIAVSSLLSTFSYYSKIIAPKDNIVVIRLHHGDGEVCHYRANLSHNQLKYFCER